MTTVQTTYMGNRAERRGAADRRRLSWRTFAVGLSSTRRRAARRHEHGFYVDWYGPGLFTSATLLTLLCALDAFITLELLRLGGRELNPVMDWLIRADLAAFIAAKMALTCAGVTFLVLHQNFRLLRRLPVAWVVHAAALGYVVLFIYETRLLVQALTL